MQTGFSMNVKKDHLCSGLQFPESGNVHYLILTFKNSERG